MVDNEQELKKLLNVSVQKQLEGLAILYWGEIYEGKFLATVDFGDLPKFAEYAIKAMGYVKWDGRKVAKAILECPIENVGCDGLSQHIFNQLKEIPAIE